MRRLLPTLWLLPVLILAGCETPPRATDFAEITFRHLPPVALRVERRSVATYEPATEAAEPGHIELAAPLPPADAIALWAGHRFRPAGTSGRLVIEIQEASLTEERLEQTQGIRGLFTVDQSERYHLKLAVRLLAFDASARLLGQVQGRAERSETVAEDASLYDREAVWYRMTEAALNDLDAEVVPRLRETLPELFVSP